MEFKEKLNELEKCIEEKLKDFEHDTGLIVSFVTRSNDKGFDVRVRSR